jgi:hypothetical protein
MQEKKIRCALCKREFLIGLSEKQYLTVMGFAEPTICPSCQEKEIKWNHLKQRRKNNDKKKYFRLKYGL